MERQSDNSTPSSPAVASPTALTASTRASASRRQIAVIGVLVVGYALLSHFSETRPDARGLGAALSVGPVVLIGLVLLWRWTRPTVAALITLAMAACLYRFWDPIERNFEWADLVQQCGIYALVALSFARTLIAGRVPLCTQLAQKIHPILEARELAYTRGATAVWACFYLLLAAAIGGLFFTVTQATWSAFVNFATFGFIATGCVVDAGLRHWILPRRPGGGVVALLRQALIG